MPHPDDVDLLATPLDQLMAAAASVRDSRTGTRITYSPKISPLVLFCMIIWAWNLVSFF